MRVYLSLPELLAMVEIIDEHVERNFPGIDPPRVLRDLKLKADRSVERHHAEIARTIRASRTVTAKATPRQKKKNNRRVSARA
jgi:hypothetical protein